MVAHPASTIQERRRFPRQDTSPPFAINLLKSDRSITVNHINMSVGGLCLRVEEELEVRSLVQVQFTPTRVGFSEIRTEVRPVPGESHAGERMGSRRSGRPVTCTGRVTWVIQRLDLRQSAPFLFDVGIEFVDPPPTLRQLMAREGLEAAAKQGRPLRTKALESSLVRGRSFVPRLERSMSHALRWHLVVSVDGIPCFSERFATEREALAAWVRFRRQQAKR